MVYNFSKTSNSLIATLDTENGKYDEHIIECFQPNIFLGQERIVLKESSLRVQDFLFESIGQINGETPTNLIDGFEMLESFIKSIFVLGTGGSDVGYKIYRALVSQTGSEDPTAVILENTLGESVIWKRSTTGGYTAEKTSGFDITKTFYNTNGLATINVQLFSFVNTFNNKLVINIRDIISDLPMDGQLRNTPIEILVYE